MTDLCGDCDRGEHATCAFALRREAGMCACRSSRHDGRRAQTRRVGSLVLTSTGDGRWAEPTGRYSVERDDDFITFCENPHPMRNGYCYGAEEHYYTRWGVWDHEKGDFAEGCSPGDFARFADAAAWLGRHLTAKRAGLAVDQ